MKRPDTVSLKIGKLSLHAEGETEDGIFTCISLYPIVDGTVITSFDLIHVFEDLLPEKDAWNLESHLDDLCLDAILSNASPR